VATRSRSPIPARCRTRSRSRRTEHLVEAHGRVVGVDNKEGSRLTADFFVIACGSWTPRVVPWLGDVLAPAAQPVFHLKPADPSRFQPHVFPTFGADIARTGYYGFPATHDGIVKIANHGPGRLLDPDASRVVPPEEEEALRAFLRETFPALVDAPIVDTHICIYCDTPDEHFWIDRDPERPNLVVATGGSGHAFKFAPLIGGWVADALEGTTIERFRWRADQRARGEEAARKHTPR
jgi:glycine/D-amino acid oxidase-like deaminating enzyme